MEVQRGPGLPKVSWQVMMEPEFAPFLSDTKFCAGSAVSSGTSHFSPAPETHDLRGSADGGWWLRGYGGGERHSTLCKDHWAASPLHVPGLSGPRATCGNLLFLRSTTRPSFLPLGLLSLEALHLPQPQVGLGWGWTGGRLGFDGQLGSPGRRPGLLPHPHPSWLQKGSGGGGNFTGKLLFLPRTDRGWGRSFPLAATETGAT